MGLVFIKYMILDLAAVVILQNDAVEKWFYI